MDHIGPRTVPLLLAERIDRYPDAVASVFESRDGSVTEYTYAELGDAVARAAGGLAGLGIGRGDKVVLCMANRPEMVIGLLALAHLGAVAVPANTANALVEMTHVSNWSDARLVITTAEFVPLFDQVRAAVPALAATVVAGDGAGPGAPSFAGLLDGEPVGVAEIDSEDPLEIIFTSGTTALPKGVVLTHANWLWSGERATHWLRLDERDRLLSALPLFHVNAQTFTLLASLTLGATSIFLEEYSASRFMDQVRAHEATYISIVAMLLRTIMAQPESDLDRGHRLRRVSYAINVPEAEKNAFERRFGVELLNGYGLSEAMTEVSVCPVYGEKRWPSIGQPAFGREVRVVDEEGRSRPTGEAGEIVVRGVPGRTIMKEYYKDPTATAAAIVDGWLHTGDNGYFDERGYLYFVDRSKDMIKRAGENVSATEVEGVLLEDERVALAAVIGVPDPVRDEAVMAFVVAEPGATLSEDDVIAHCEQRLARFKVPSIVAIRDELPVTSIGKVEKKALRQSVAGAGGATVA
ncbi:MAG: AMP-binding protein [Actinobacteria bacterium]|nr:AMP-binding protein [Actinomycetota bacterium]